MYLAKNGARDLYGPKKVAIRKPSSVVAPMHKNDYSVDSVSVNSHDRTSSPQQNTKSSSNTKVVRTNHLSQKQLLPTVKKIPGSLPWYKSRKGLLITAGIVLLISGIIVLPTVLAVVLTRNPSVASTTASPTVIQTACWNFDGTVNDLYNVYNGSLSGPVAYSNTTYFGYGYSLILNGSMTSFVNISSPFFNLSYTSFTVEAWIYLFTTTGDNTIFSQCECGGCPSQCLSLVVRSGKLYMAFSLNVLLGNTAMLPNTWYHISYVYDYSNRTQSVYLQGVLDGTKTSSDPYQGQNGSILIGASNLSSSFYNGLIDDLRLSTAAKSVAHLLNDATLVAYFSFDSSTLTNDLGPNKIYSTLSNAGAVTGKVGQALSLSGTSSFFQAYAFYQLSQVNKEFSIALWINPTVPNGTLIQKTKFQTSTLSVCSVFITFSTIGQIVFGIPTSSGGNSQIIGPFISINQWTHLGYTYSQTNGVTMYINGIKQGATGNVSYYTAGNNYEWLNIGQFINIACSLSLVYNGYYQGSLDEFYIYRRELSASAIAALANYN